jgi:hypothetical protein
VNSTLQSPSRIGLPLAQCDPATPQGSRAACSHDSAPTARQDHSKRLHRVAYIKVLPSACELRVLDLNFGNVLPGVEPLTGLKLLTGLHTICKSSVAPADSSSDRDGVVLDNMLCCLVHHHQPLCVPLRPVTASGRPITARERF